MEKIVSKITALGVPGVVLSEKETERRVGESIMTEKSLKIFCPILDMS